MIITGWRTNNIHVLFISSRSDTANHPVLKAIDVPYNLVKYASRNCGRNGNTTAVTRPYHLPTRLVSQRSRPVEEWIYHTSWRAALVRTTASLFIYEDVPKLLTILVYVRSPCIHSTLVSYSYTYHIIFITRFLYLPYHQQSSWNSIHYFNG